MSNRTANVLAVVVCAAIVTVCSGALWAADPVDLQRSAQAKLLAARAARADAMRKLGERIQGLVIVSETKVEDFVTSSDQIRSRMRAFLSGAKQVGKAKHMEDGTCEVTLEVPVEEVIVNLKRWHKTYYKGDKIKIRDLEKLSVTIKDKTFRATGMGARREVEALDEGGDAVAIRSDGNLQSMTYLRGKAKAFWLAHVTGRGRLMAVRAARVVAMRRLGERIRGVAITSDTTVQDFVAESDDINVNMRAFLRGMRENRIRYYDDELIVEVELAVTYRSIYTSLKSWGEAHFKGDKVKMRKVEELIVKTKDEVLTEVGMGTPPEKYLKNVDKVTVAVMGTATNAPPWIATTITATGQGAVDAQGRSAAQAKLMAFRAAELDARRKLAERINGLRITSNTSVADFVTQNDQIDTSMMAFQQGARVLDRTKKLMEDGTAEITVEIDLKPLWNLIIHYQKTLKITIK